MDTTERYEILCRDMIPLNLENDLELIEFDADVEKLLVKILSMKTISLSEVMACEGLSYLPPKGHCTVSMQLYQEGQMHRQMPVSEVKEMAFLNSLIALILCKSKASDLEVHDVHNFKTHAKYKPDTLLCTRDKESVMLGVTSNFFVEGKKNESFGTPEHFIQACKYVQAILQNFFLKKAYFLLASSSQIYFMTADKIEDDIKFSCSQLYSLEMEQDQIPKGILLLKKFIEDADVEALKLPKFFVSESNIEVPMSPAGFSLLFLRNHTSLFNSKNSVLKMVHSASEFIAERDALKKIQETGTSEYIFKLISSSKEESPGWLH